MHFNPNDNRFSCLSGILSKDHGAFNSLYRWAIRHMLTEVLVVGLIIYIQFQDRIVGIFCLIAAVISLAGASIPTLCFSNSLGWRTNFIFQIFATLMRLALIAYICVQLAKSVANLPLVGARICELSTIVLSSASLFPFFILSYELPWLLHMRPLEDEFYDRNYRDDEYMEEYYGENANNEGSNSAANTNRSNRSNRFAWPTLLGGSASKKNEAGGVNLKQSSKSTNGGSRIKPRPGSGHSRASEESRASLTSHGYFNKQNKIGVSNEEHYNSKVDKNSDDVSVLDDDNLSIASKVSVKPSFRHRISNEQNTSKVGHFDDNNAHDDNGNAIGMIIFVYIYV
jgi:hypothetical protein